MPILGPGASYPSIPSLSDIPQSVIAALKRLVGSDPVQAGVGAIDPTVAAALQAYAQPAPKGDISLPPMASAPVPMNKPHKLRLAPAAAAPAAPAAPSGIPDWLKTAPQGVNPQNPLGGVGGQLFGKSNNLNFMDPNGPQQAPLPSTPDPQDVTQLPQGADQTLPQGSQHNRFSTIMRAILGMQH